MKKVFLLLLLLPIISVTTKGQIKEVELVVNATGSSKEGAINNALRSAIEQSFGAFVSANTVLLNDELVKDEIVTVSSGTIKKYTELSDIALPNGLYAVSLKVLVSVLKLTEYAKSHGSSCELAGALIGANLKMERLYENNERTVIENLMTQVSMIKGVVNAEIALGSVTANGVYIELTLTATQELQRISELVFNTLSSISLDKDAIAAREALGLKVYENKFLRHFNKLNGEYTYLTIFTRTEFSSEGESSLEKALIRIIEEILNDFRVSSNISSPVKYKIDSMETLKGGIECFLLRNRNRDFLTWQGHPFIGCKSQNNGEPLPFFWSFPTNTRTMIRGGDIIPLLDGVYYTILDGSQQKYKSIAGKKLGTVTWRYYGIESDLSSLSMFFVEPVPEERPAPNAGQNSPDPYRPITPGLH